MKALVLGLGISGKSAATFLEKRGYEVLGVDDQFAPTAIEDVKSFDLFVPSPGISKRHPLYQRALAANLPIKGEVQLGLEETAIPCIGVTGTNGKTTVVEMISFMMNRAGVRAKAVGNVGEPITSCLEEGSELFVVELSSFQLDTLQGDFFDLGMILNIGEDHLDWHGSKEEYAAAKMRLATCIKQGGVFALHDCVDARGDITFSGGNEEAALFACRHFGIDGSLEGFSRGRHRLEEVGVIGGVRYLNDSKATNVSAVLFALGEVKGRIHLLLGGRDKGLSFAPLIPALERVESVIAFGEAREKIADQLKKGVEVHGVATLEEAVHHAKLLARPGDVVLFSPGCASFDAFQNYQKRGEAFTSCVKETPE